MPAEPRSPAGCSSPKDHLQLAAECAERLGVLRRDAARSSALMSTGQTAELAATVEAISRTVEYLQIVCAAALDNHRVAEAFGQGAVTVSASCADRPATAESGAAPGFGPEPGDERETGTTVWNDTWALSDAPAPDASGADIPPQSSDSPAQRAAGRGAAEFRTTADYMRCRLRITRGEAQRRLRLASVLLPSVGTSGQPILAGLPHLAETAAAGEVSSAAAGIISDAVEQVRRRTDAGTASAMERDLSAVARLQDQDFLTRMARRWVILADQDGADPSEEELRRFQGVFSGRKRNGLNHLSIFCTAEQHETLLTVMNAAAGPTGDPGSATCPTVSGAGSPVYAQRFDGSPFEPYTVTRLDRRTRPQRLLEGLVDAAKAMLAQGGVPASGGMRPQVLVTIDSVSLLREFDYGSVVKGVDSLEEPAAPHVKQREAARPGSFAFTGPVPAASVRKLACDADMLPVVLSGSGRILDIGRTQRLFPPHLRKALHARDGGCAFPGCTIPGPWTEAHHIRYWRQGGPTSTDNGVLLCSHHHHEVHKENWRIRVLAGVPWFVPPAYVDPDRVPLRNTYFRPHALGCPAEPGTRR